MPVPVSLTRWLASTYPTLDVDEQWLSDCCDYLTTTQPDLSPAKLIKNVEEQLLLSDLGSSVSPPGALASLTVEGDDAYDLSRTRGVLVQLLSITEIGHSAFNLQEAHAKRLDERRGGQVIVGNVEDGSVGPTTFPRSMLAMQLSDGYTTLKAIEYERLPSLTLGDVRLGAKLLLKACRVRRGVAFLTPATAIYKGGGVQELDEEADETFEAGLRERLGPQQQQARGQPAPRARPRRASPARPRPAPAPTLAPAPPAPPRAIEIDEDGEEDFEMQDLDPALFDALDQAEQAALSQRQAQQRALRLDVDSGDDDDDDEGLWAGMDDVGPLPDEIWPDDEVEPGPKAKLKAASVISLSSD